MPMKSSEKQKLKVKTKPQENSKVALGIQTEAAFNLKTTIDVQTKPAENFFPITGKSITPLVNISQNINSPNQSHIEQ